MFDRKLIYSAAMTIAALTTAQAHAAGTSALGVLDTSGTNPATGSEWAPGDTYHLTYVTTTQTDATSTNIADYNAFVQADASSEGFGSVNWFALGSTTTTDAIDNAVITGPVINIDNLAPVALDSADMWDFLWDGTTPGITTNEISTLSGENKNIWTGTDAGGGASSGNELGATNGTTRRHWSGWTNWGPAFATQANGDLREMVAISQELSVVPEPTSLALLGMGGLLLARRRRG